MNRSPAYLQGLACFALAASAVCAPASAWAQQQTVTLAGEAGLRCTLGQPVLGDGPLTNFDSPAGTVFSITQLADPETLSTQATNITLSVDAMCNSLHRVVIASDNNGLWRTGAPATGGFGDAVPYQANVVWADQQHLLTADTSARQNTEETMLINRPNSGQLLIEFDINTGATNAGVGAPLLAGEYSDVLRITVEAQ